MYIETPKPPLLLGFRLTVYPSPQFLQINGRLYLRSIRITRLHCYYEPLRHPVCLRPFSRVHSYRTDPSPGISPGASRTSPVSIVSLLPCRRQYPADVNYSLSQSEIAHIVFADF